MVANGPACFTRGRSLVQSQARPLHTVLPNEVEERCRAESADVVHHCDREFLDAPVRVGASEESNARLIEIAVAELLDGDALRPLSVELIPLAAREPSRRRRARMPGVVLARARISVLVPLSRLVARRPSNRPREQPTGNVEIYVVSFNGDEVRRLTTSP